MDDPSLALREGLRAEMLLLRKELSDQIATELALTRAELCNVIATELRSTPASSPPPLVGGVDRKHRPSRVQIVVSTTTEASAPLITEQHAAAPFRPLRGSVDAMTQSDNGGGFPPRSRTFLALSQSSMNYSGVHVREGLHFTHGSDHDTTSSPKNPFGSPLHPQMDRLRRNHRSGTNSDVDGLNEVDFDTFATSTRRIAHDATPTVFADGGAETLSLAPTIERNGAQSQGGPNAGTLRRLGIPGEHPMIAVLDMLFMASVALSWLGASFYSINGVDGPNSDLLMHSVALCVVAQVYGWIWIGSRFFVQVRRGDWEVLETLTDIRQHYLSFWFKFDAALAIPFDWVFLGWQPQIFFYCQLRHVLKLARFISISSGSNPLVHERRVITQFGRLMVIVCVIHTAASIVCRMNNFEYIAALYWATVTMSSVGYGDKNATDDSRRIFGVFIIALGVCLMTALTAITTSMLTAQDAVTMAVNAKKRLLASMMSHYHVPWAVQLEVIGAFPTALEHGNEEQFKTLIENLPPFIVEKLTTYIRAKVVSDAIPQFQKCPAEVLLQVASRLLHRFIPANEAIVRAGDEGTEMYFLVRGVAEVLVAMPNGSVAVIATLRSGTFFGEIALVTENCRRTASVFTVVLCEILVLNKMDFEDLAVQHAEVKEFFGEVIQEATTRTRVRRAKVLSTEEPH